MISAKRRAHGPYRRVRRLAVVACERDHFVPDVGVVLALHPAAVQRMRVAVGKRVAMVDVDAERLDLAAVDDLADGADEALALVFLLVAAAGREHDQRRAPVAQYDDPELSSDPFRIPAMM